MGSGLSMASVNKIKELAEQREYSLAMDIVDSQDLSKSLNPQFLRICGDIYMYNGRYKDARKMFVMAHKLAPEGKRVMYSLTDLYLKMGYMNLAERYYELYLFDADALNEETNQIKYIYGKAHKADESELYALLCPHYIHNMDYDWSFETYLLLKKIGKDQDAEILAGDYLATYKNTKNSECISDIEAGKENVDTYYNVFSEVAVEDEDPEQEELRIEEAALLEADDLRINPKEAEITIVVDDYEEVDIGTKRRHKKRLKTEEKNKNKESDIEESAEEKETTEEAVDEITEETVKEEEQISEKQDIVSEDSKEDTEIEDTEIEEAVEKKGFFKKVFSRKKKSEIPDEENSEDKPAEEDNTADSVTEQEDTDNSEIVNDEKLEDEAEDVLEEKEEDSMRELHTNKHNPVISIDFGNDDFSAESDTVDDLKDEDFSNPFDGISVFKEEKESHTFVPKRKNDISFDDIDLSFDDDNEFDVDDFSFPDDEFGTMEEEDIEETSYEEEIARVEEVEYQSEELEETEYETEETEAEDVEYETEETEVEDVEYEESYTDVEEAEEYVEETSEELFYEEEIARVEEVEYQSEELEETEYETEEPETEELELEDVEYETEEPEAEDVEYETEESEVEETEYEESYTYAEETEEYVDEPSEESFYEEEIAETDEVEYQSEELEETEYEAEDVEYETEEPEAEEIEYETSYTDAEETQEVETEEILTDPIPENQSYTGDYVEEDVEINIPVRESVIPEQQKIKLDFPVFRSSLFPNHNKEVKQVENNFNEIMTKGQDKIQESLLKEEQMHREAEALLASLGIDLGSVTVSSNSMESINETLYNEPSRDDLKASLKIDAFKKDILKKIKEYR